MSRPMRFAPLLLVVLVLTALVWRLATPADTTIRSRLEGKPVPSFELPPAVPAKSGLSSVDLASGQPRLVNLFASWCIPCITEAPVLGDLQRRGVSIDAIAIRDRPQDVAAFLARYGDPFQRIGSDQTSQVQLALGSSGVPESFVVDGRGIIRYQHIGAIKPDDVDLILDHMEKAR